METVKKYSGRLFTLEVLGILIALLFLVPFYFVIVNSLKTFPELAASTAKLPQTLYLDNYKKYGRS